MRLFLHRKPLSHRKLSFSKKPNRAILYLRRHPLLCDLILIVLAAGLIYGFVSYFHRFSQPLQAHVEIDLSPFSLFKYTFFSMSRGLLGFLVALLFSLIWGFWAAQDRVAERALIPVLDIFQSTPILGFMPGLVLLLVALFPNSNIGLELAAILMIFTSQAWNMAFGVYHSLRIIPEEKVECAVVYRFSNWQRIRWLYFPCIVISLLWNSIMSMAGGWFFLVVNEAFKLGDRDFQLPGLGSYMSVAAANGDIPAMIWAIIAMIALIVFLDSILWRPLIAWSQKFRMEEIASNGHSETLFFQVLSHSFLINKVRQGVHLVSKFLPKMGQIKFLSPKLISRVCLGILLGGIAIALVFLIREVLEVQLAQWFHLSHMALLTFGRVMSCIVIGTCIALPLGLWVGLSEKLSKHLEPLIQITASFPATLLFPILVLFFRKVGISLNIGSVLLMLMGSLWYILFNVLAGTKAMPSDLKEVAVIFGLKKWQKFWRLDLPAIFPYFITGLVNAAGGAWNASIVAEYISYKDQIFTVPGLGSTINLSAQRGDIPLLIASVLVMVVVVVTLNYQVWLKLFHYSEKRFSLNY